MKIGIYHSVYRTKTRDKIATIYDIQIIYGRRKYPLESLETKYKCIIMLVEYV